MAKRILRVFSAGLGLVFIFISPVFSQNETLTITTYYPSPYGSYRELKANMMAIGSAYSGAAYADGNLYVSGSVGIRSVAPGEVLDVSGAIRLRVPNPASNNNPGTIRWTGTDFEGRKGANWVSMTTGDLSWTPIARVLLGTVNPLTFGTWNYAIPAAVPATAREVLVYWYLWAGDNPGLSNSLLESAVYTDSAGVNYIFYLFGLLTSPATTSFTSNNVWLPVTANRTIHLTISGAFAPTGAGETGAYVIGYR